MPWSSGSSAGSRTVCVEVCGGGSPQHHSSEPETAERNETHLIKKVTRWTPGGNQVRIFWIVRIFLFHQIHFMSNIINRGELVWTDMKWCRFQTAKACFFFIHWLIGKLKQMLSYLSAAVSASLILTVNISHFVIIKLSTNQMLCCMFLFSYKQNAAVLSSAQCFKVLKKHNLYFCLQWIFSWKD